MGGRGTKGGIASCVGDISECIIHVLEKPSIAQHNDFFPFLECLPQTK